MARKLFSRQTTSQQLRARFFWPMTLMGVALAAIFFMAQTNAGGGPSGHEGPAGVGDSGSNNFWFGISDLGAADGTPIGNVPDWSGNDHPLSGSGTAQPTFLNNATDQLNGKAILRFDGVDDVLQLPNSGLINTIGPYEEKTIIIAFQTGSDVHTQQFLLDEGGSTRGLVMYIDQGNFHWGGFNVLDDDETTPWPYTGLSSSIDPNSTNIAILEFDFPNDEFSAYLNGDWVGTQSGIGRLHAHGDLSGFGAIISDSRDADGAIGSPIDRRYFGGDILEMVGYNSILNNSQRLILENYLAGKFDIAINSDAYDYEFSHSYQIAGIWAMADGSTHEDAQARGVLRIASPSSLDADEGLIWGHNGIDLSQGNTTDIDPTSGIASRLERSWRTSISGSPGTVHLTLDVSDMSIGNPADLRLLIERNGDNFLSADVPPISGMYNAGEQTITFSAVSLQDGDLFTLGSNSLTFPVELTSFEAISLGTVIQLNWSTATETNNDYFAIERSADGQGFQSIGRETGVGTSQESQQYQFVDTQPLAGLGYYRICQVDYDGSFSFSQVQSVRLSEWSSQSLEIYPNPLSGDQALQLKWINQQSGVGTIQLTSLDGKVAFSERISMQEGSQQHQLDLSQVAAGAYLVQIQQAGVYQVQQLVIQ
ncbi:MAG: T9SS type A sorting domain-containing protein [Bacteroidota bacterium]